MTRRIQAKTKKPFLRVEPHEGIAVYFRLDEIRTANWMENFNAWGASLELQFGDGVTIELSGTQARQVYEMLKVESVLLEKE